MPVDEALMTKAISAPRLESYLAVVGNGSVADALRLYQLNTELSASFLLPMQSLEITLRNAIAERLDAYFGSSDWLISLPQASRRDVWSDDQLVTVMDCWNRARRLKKEPFQPDIIADLHFGFWTQFLDKPQHRLWTVLQSAFPNAPAGTQRSVLFEELNPIRKFRNRIAHHEIIVNRDIPATVMHDRMIETLHWMNIAISGWARSNSRVPAVWSEIRVEAASSRWSGIPQ